MGEDESLDSHWCISEPVEVCQRTALATTAELTAWVNRRLLDAQLEQSLSDSSILGMGENNLVIEAMLSLLEGDGLTN